MLSKVFSVFDSCACYYDRPFISRDVASAVRSFGDIACNAEHVIGQHPEHYSLFCIGTFDDSSGVIVPEVAVCVGMAHELVARSRVVDADAVFDMDSVVKNRVFGDEDLKGDGNAS